MAGKEIEVLRELVREMRDEPDPEIDWDRVEEQLMETVESDAPAPLPRRSAWPAVAFVAAVAAVALVGIGVLTQQRKAQSVVPKAPVAQLPHMLKHHVYGMTQTKVSGDKLAVGDRVVARAEPVRVEHKGRVVWTLHPNSVAALVASGRYLTVRLQSGSVTADVVPSPRPESFAVEVKDTRIAVHGTHFTVERVGDQAKVTLQRGVIVVGPASERGHTRGWLMKAPATGSFSLDGARTGHVEQGKPPSPKPAAALQVPTPVAHVAPSKKAVPAPPSKQTTPPTEPAQSDLLGGAEKVAEKVRSCFASHTTAGKGTRISAHSKLSIDIAPAGNITTLRFDPPLAPSVQRCSASVMQSVHFPASTQGATVTRTLELEQ